MWLWLLKTVESIAPPEEVKCCNWWWWSIIAIDDDEEEEEEEEDEDDDDVAFLRTAMFLTFSNASRNAFCTATAL